MAGRGPAPKPAAERVRRNLDVPPSVTVSPDNAVRGFDLPELGDCPLTGEPRGWPRQTLRWWETWRKSPQSQTFTDTDWDFLAETAMIHRAFVMGDLKQAAELRLRVGKYGATPEDRMRLRLQITAPSEAKPEPTKTPASAAGRKDRLLKAVQ